MKKIEFKHLAPYLPYGLKVMYTDGKIYEVCGLNIYSDCILNVSGVETLPFKDIKPILRPLSDLSEVGNQMERDCNHTIWYENGAWSDSMTDDFSIDWIPKVCYEWLIERHFDVFGLLDSGLAININTLD